MISCGYSHEPASIPGFAAKVKRAARVRVRAINENGLPVVIEGDGLLARCLCGYLTLFWGIRLSLQLVFDVKEHLTTWWLRAGYFLLTVLFLSFTLVYAYAALRPGG